MRDYREAVEGMTRPLNVNEKRVEMLAMFLCDSGIVPLGPSRDGSRLSGGHGWHRTTASEQEEYRRRASEALRQIDMTTVSA